MFEEDLAERVDSLFCEISGGSLSNFPTEKMINSFESFFCRYCRIEVEKLFNCVNF
jgi:hypothetical protein